MRRSDPEQKVFDAHNQQMETHPRSDVRDALDVSWTTVVYDNYTYGIINWHQFLNSLALLPAL